MSNDIRDTIIQAILATSAMSEGVMADAIISALQIHQDPAVWARPDQLRSIKRRGNGLCVLPPEQMQSDWVPLYSKPQPSAQVPEGWPTDEMVARGAENLSDSLRAHGIDIDFDKDLRGSEIQQDIAEAVFNYMIDFAPTTAQKPQWIPCSERLPTAADSDPCGNVWGYELNEKAWLVAYWHTVRMCPEDFSHWMPTGLVRPEPPEDSQ